MSKARLQLPNLPDISNVAGARRVQLRMATAGRMPPSKFTMPLAAPKNRMNLAPAGLKSPGRQPPGFMPSVGQQSGQQRPGFLPSIGQQRPLAKRPKL